MLNLPAALNGLVHVQPPTFFGSLLYANLATNRRSSMLPVAIVFSIISIFDRCRIKDPCGVLSRLILLGLYSARLHQCRTELKLFPLQQVYGNVLPRTYRYSLCYRTEMSPLGQTTTPARIL